VIGEVAKVPVTFLKLKDEEDADPYMARLRAAEKGELPKREEASDLVPPLEAPALR